MGATVSVRDVIAGAFAQQLEDDGKTLPQMDDSLVLLESGLDSLGFAVLVTVLEEQLGYDPFSLMDEPVYPRTLGEFVAVYEDNRP